MKDIMKRIKFEYVFAMSFVILLYISVFMFRGQQDIIKTIIDVVKDIILMVATFFFTKHQTGTKE